MPHVIEDFFTAQETNDALAVINQAQPFWQKCHQTGMYILGNSLFRKINFRDGQVFYGSYFEDNIFHFEQADLLKEKLSSMFDNVVYTNEFSKPGFQIIKRDEDKQPSVWHYDNMITMFPYNVEFDDYDFDFSNYFDEYYIFTLMLSDGEFSFDYFPETDSSFGKDILDASTNTPICKDHVNLVGDNCSNPNCELKKYETIKYTKGSLLVQNERVLHRVGSRDINGSHSLRATLQTYGVVKDGTLYLFW